MSINTFWKIIIKFIGLLLLFKSISIIPQFFSTLSFIDGNIDFMSLLSVWLINLSVLIVFILIIRLFLFKSQWLIELLRLDKNFNEDKININVQPSSVLTIAIIVLGGLLLIENLPSFCSELFSFLQQKSLFKNYPDSYWLIFHFLKIILGYILLTNGRRIAQYIGKENNLQEK